MDSDIAAGFTPPPPDGAAGADLDHSVWDGLLARHCRPIGDALGDAGTGVAYGAFSAADRAALEAYLAAMQARGVAGLGRAGQFAFWINLYNARTVALVLEHYPVASIRDIDLGGGLRAAVLGGPWQKKLLRVAGVALSLDDVENAILRRLFRDARLHYALNCASIGCPSLAARAYTAAGLEAALDEAARGFIASPRGVRFGPAGPVLSRIFDWYRRDFGGDDQAVLRHLAGHAEPGLRARLLGAQRIAGYDYDWRLNDARTR